MKLPGSVPKGALFEQKMRRDIPEFQNTGYWGLLAGLYNRTEPRYFWAGFHRAWFCRELGRRYDARPGEATKRWGKGW